MSGSRIGVLALQGDVREHLAALATVGATGTPVRRAAELDTIDGLIIPGGESTTIAHLLGVFDLFEGVQARIAAGLPVYGSCAGMILLADRVLDGAPNQRTLGGLNVTVRRNAFGRQVDSFEEDLIAPDLVGDPEPMRAVYIRAPWVQEAGPGVQVLARAGTGAARGRIVAVRQGALMATSFHPEIGSDVRVHRAFTDLVASHS